MYKLISFFSLFLTLSAAMAQHTEWRTGVRDTSYSSRSDYAQNVKKFPFIRLVPDSPVASVAEQRRLVYARIGSRELHLDAFLPSAMAGRTPAILIVHGGGWRSGDRSQHIPLAQHLAARGIACFTVEYRLSTEAFFPAAVYDLKAAVRWLHANATRFSTDPAHISVLGFSAGGQLAALMGVTNGLRKFEGSEGVPAASSAVNAVIDIDGTLSFVHPDAWETQHPDKIGASAWWIGYPRTERLDLWNEASPLTYAEANKTPFLFLNSAVERMHAGRTDFKTIMDAHHVLTEIVEFPHTPHSFCLYEPWFPQVVDSVVSFVGRVDHWRPRAAAVSGSPAASAEASSGKDAAVWSPDLGNGRYKNPVIDADYSDPDVVRVGSDFYLTSSSFEDIPGLPILHSKDLVNWEIIGHALLRQPPFDHFDVPRHGDGVWAPAIRYYHNEFFLYYPDPDYGIYLTKAAKPSGPWSPPVLVYPGKGIIDPCPFIDDDGSMYLVHAFAGSRAGIKSVLAINRLNKEGTQVTDDGVLVYDGHAADPTIEGPKLYKRRGYYYIFAPAGGVGGGWQVVLRSKNIYGPYERKVVMAQGSSATNGPHQGAWVSTVTGEDWFLHFQDKGPYGRVVHLEPMVWKDGWPVIGEDKDGDGTGEPVASFRKPNVGKTYPVSNPAEGDEFNGRELGLQWQWMANTQAGWYYMNIAMGSLRLYALPAPAEAKNLWQVPNVLLQKFPADEFVVTTRLSFTRNPKLENERAGLTVMGLGYADIFIRSAKDGLHLCYGLCKDAESGGAEEEHDLAALSDSTVYLRVQVRAGAVCRFSYSLDGQAFVDAGETFSAAPGRWIGAKVGLFCTGSEHSNDAGYADVDWFRVEKLP